LTLLGEGGFIPGVVAVVDGHDEEGGTEVHVEGQEGGLKLSADLSDRLFVGAA